MFSSFESSTDIPDNNLKVIFVLVQQIQKPKLSPEVYDSIELNKIKKLFRKPVPNMTSESFQSNYDSNISLWSSPQSYPIDKEHKARSHTRKIKSLGREQSSDSMKLRMSMDSLSSCKKCQHLNYSASHESIPEITLSSFDVKHPNENYQLYSKKTFFHQPSPLLYKSSNLSANLRRDQNCFSETQNNLPVRNGKYNTFVDDTVKKQSSSILKSIKKASDSKHSCECQTIISKNSVGIQTSLQNFRLNEKTKKGEDYFSIFSSSNKDIHSMQSICSENDKFTGINSISRQNKNMSNCTIKIKNGSNLNNNQDMYFSEVPDPTFKNATKLGKIYNEELNKSLDFKNKSENLNPAKFYQSTFSTHSLESDPNSQSDELNVPFFGYHNQNCFKGDNLFKAKLNNPKYYPYFDSIYNQEISQANPKSDRSSMNFYFPLRKENHKNEYLWPIYEHNPKEKNTSDVYENNADKNEEKCNNITIRNKSSLNEEQIQKFVSFLNLHNPCIKSLNEKRHSFDKLSLPFIKITKHVSNEVDDNINEFTKQTSEDNIKHLDSLITKTNNVKTEKISNLSEDKLSKSKTFTNLSLQNLNKHQVVATSLTKQSGFEENLNNKNCKETIQEEKSKHELLEREKDFLFNLILSNSSLSWLLDRSNKKKRKKARIYKKHKRLINKQTSKHDLLSVMKVKGFLHCLFKCRKILSKLVNPNVSTSSTQLAPIEKLYSKYILKNSISSLSSDISPNSETSETNTDKSSLVSKTSESKNETRSLEKINTNFPINLNEKTIAESLNSNNNQVLNNDFELIICNNETSTAVPESITDRGEEQQINEKVYESDDCGKQIDSDNDLQQLIKKLIDVLKTNVHFNAKAKTLNNSVEVVDEKENLISQWKNSLSKIIEKNILKIDLNQLVDNTITATLAHSNTLPSLFLDELNKSTKGSINLSPEKTSNNTTIETNIDEYYNDSSKCHLNNSQEILDSEKRKCNSKNNFNNKIFFSKPLTDKKVVNKTKPIISSKAKDDYLLHILKQAEMVQSQKLENILTENDFEYHKVPSQCFICQNVTNNSDISRSSQASFNSECSNETQESIIIRKELHWELNAKEYNNQKSKKICDALFKSFEALNKNKDSAKYLRWSKRKLSKTENQYNNKEISLKFKNYFDAVNTYFTKKRIHLTTSQQKKEDRIKPNKNITSSHSNNSVEFCKDCVKDLLNLDISNSWVSLTANPDDKNNYTLRKETQEIFNCLLKKSEKFGLKNKTVTNACSFSQEPSFQNSYVKPQQQTLQNSYAIARNKTLQNNFIIPQEQTLQNTYAVPQEQILKSGFLQKCADQPKPPNAHTDSKSYRNFPLHDLETFETLYYNSCLENNNKKLNYADYLDTNSLFTGSTLTSLSVNSVSDEDIKDCIKTQQLSSLSLNNKKCDSEFLQSTSEKELASYYMDLEKEINQQCGTHHFKSNFQFEPNIKAYIHSQEKNSQETNNSSVQKHKVNFLKSDGKNTVPHKLPKCTNYHVEIKRVNKKPHNLVSESKEIFGSTISETKNKTECLSSYQKDNSNCPQSLNAKIFSNLPYLNLLEEFTNFCKQKFNNIKLPTEDKNQTLINLSAHTASNGNVKPTSSVNLSTSVRDSEKSFNSLPEICLSSLTNSVLNELQEYFDLVPTKQEKNSTSTTME